MSSERWLKQTGTSHWNSPNTGATNSSGFTALPGGRRSGIGTFNRIRDYGDWWSATEGGTAHAWHRYMDYDYSEIYRLNFSKEFGFSVRCIKD